MRLMHMHESMRSGSPDRRNSAGVARLLPLYDALGGGTPLFKPGGTRRLKLIDSRTMSNGILILRYEPAAAK